MATLPNALSNVLFDLLNADPSSGRVPSQSLESISQDNTNLGQANALAQLQQLQQQQLPVQQNNQVQLQPQLPQTTNQPLLNANRTGGVIDRPPNVQEEDLNNNLPDIENKLVNALVTGSSLPLTNIRAEGGQIQSRVNPIGNSPLANMLGEATSNFSISDILDFINTSVASESQNPNRLDARIRR